MRLRTLGSPLELGLTQATCEPDAEMPADSSTDGVDGDGDGAPGFIQE
jgi:hypothetical protein